MLKKLLATSLALSLLGLLALAPTAEARRGNDNPPEPPECQVEDGGIIVCR